MIGKFVSKDHNGILEMENKLFNILYDCWLDKGAIRNLIHCPLNENITP